MSKGPYVAIHDLDADTAVAARVQKAADPFAILRIDHDAITLYTHDPVFLRKLANTASALAHELDLALAGEQVAS